MFSVTVGCAIERTESEVDDNRDVGDEESVSDFQAYCDALSTCEQLDDTRGDCVANVQAEHEDDSAECQQAWKGFLACSAKVGQCVDTGLEGPEWQAGPHCADDVGWLNHVCPAVIAHVQANPGEDGCAWNQRCAERGDDWTQSCRAEISALSNTGCGEALTEWEECLLEGGDCMRYDDGSVDFYAPANCPALPDSCKAELEWTAVW